MPFRRFFDRGQKPNESQEPEAEELVESPAENDEAGPDDDGRAPEDADAIDWRARANAVLCGGASTGSKRTAALYGDAEAHGPTHFVGSVGCRLFDPDGREYFDCSMALGSVSLGYAEPNVTRAVQEAAVGGNVSALTDLREIDVAERLCDVIPCAEMVQFLRTGAEAVAAAVRIARTYTGRDAVVGCGYFGWLDWSSRADGVPASVRSDYTQVPFDDVAALDRAVSEAGGRLAAIVIEPVIERLPSEEWIARARALCDATGAVLIFDELKTGFRLRTGGYQEYAAVRPDLATFGKAMANGYPLSAVVGRKDLMEAASRTWISSTLAGESTALAAAGAVLRWHQEADICESLWSIGRDLRAGIESAIVASGVSGIKTDGIDPMWMLRFDDPARETRFLELAAHHGVIFKRGAYNYAAIAHADEVIEEIEAIANRALIDLREEEQPS